MRNLFKKISMVVLVAVYASCSSTQQIAIRTTEPSPVALSNSIKKIGIINDSGPVETTGHQTGIDRLVATEDRWLNEKATDAALLGLMNELQKGGRFETVILLDSVPKTLSNFSGTANAISWKNIESICETYNVDALFSLAYFDTETQVSLKKTKMMQPDMMRVNVKVPAQEITLETLIENGWSIYDPQSRQVIDEFTFNQEIVASAKGVNPLAALRAIDNRKENVLQRGTSSGSSYGLRLQPYQKDIYRDYFVKGSENLSLAKTLVEKGDLEGATQLWQLEANHTDSKIKGRSCHNMAVSQEIKGDLDSALQWASKAQENLRNKETSSYVEELKYRMTKEQLVQAQLVQNGFLE